MKPGIYMTQFLGADYPVHYITSAANAKDYLDRLQNQQIPCYSLDTETEALPQYKNIGDAALSPNLSCVRLIQIFTGKSALIFDCKHIAKDLLFTSFLENEHFILHNAIFDIQYFYKYFGISHIDAGCTYLAAKLLFHALSPTDEGLSASLRSLVNGVFKTELFKEMQVSDWSVPELTWEQVEYSALDAISTYFLAQKLVKKINRQGLTRVYNLYKEAQHPLAKLQLSGIKLNVDAHRDMIVKWRNDAYVAKKKLLALTNLDMITPTTIAHYLEKSLPSNVLSLWPRTETGKLATDAHVFADFDFVDIVKPFEEFQRLQKLCTSFGTCLIDRVNPATGRLHAQYKLAGARTGRLSCTNPNLQQLPRDKEVRKNFVADPGKMFLCADYSQIEIRVGAELSRDATMLNAYQHKGDLHSLTAATILKKPIESITKKERQVAKCFNFGLMFGLSAKKFGHYAKKSYNVELTQEECNNGVDTWRRKYPGYREWQLEQARLGAETGVITTPCGKKRRVDPENCFGSSMNHPCQGGAGEVMLHALIRLNKELPKDVKFVNTVHDELLLELKPAKVSEIQDLMNECMTKGFLDVFPNGITKGLVSSASGNNWAEAKE
jgi:DNA polymerase I-like protein with 3'-5' exonuclease and polymerase domains